MKILIPLFFIIYTSILHAQEPIIIFDQFTPQWYIVARDTTINEVNPSGINQYNGFVLRKPELENDYTYSFFSPRNGVAEMDGALIHKIDIKEGNIHWVKNINTRYNYYQTASLSLLSSSDSTLTLVGVKRTNLNHRPFPAWGFLGYGTPWVVDIHKSTGEIIREHVNLDDTLGILQIIPGKGYFYDTQNNLIQYNGGIDNVQISKFDTTSNHFLPYQSIVLNNSIPNEKVSERSYAIYQLNDSIFIMPYYIKSKDLLLSSDEAYLDFYKQTENGYTLLKKINLHPYYTAQPQSGSWKDYLYVSISGNGEIIFYKSFKSPENQFVYKNWLLWLDHNGNEKLYLKEIKLENQTHVYSYITPIQLSSEFDFVAAFPSIEGKNGFDILKINPTGQVEKVGGLTTGDVNNNIVSSYFFVGKDGEVVMIVFWDRNFSTIIGFHMTDFGINVSSDEYTLLPKDLFRLSPNPATDEVKLDISDERYHSGTTYIYDVTGGLKHKQKTGHGGSLNVGCLTAGTYIVQYNPDSRPGYFLTTKLVKI